MDTINLNDINISSLKKLNTQGSKSVIYCKDSKCIKILTALKENEKKVLYKKLLDMDGIYIKDVILPEKLILKDDKLEGYIMDYFDNSTTFFNYFCANRFVDCKDIFKALKQASLILRDIHKNGIICKDLSLDNILIDNYGNVKFCDIDGCAYNGNMSPFISGILNEFMVNYRKEDSIIIEENTDRLCMLLSFYLLLYLKELQKLTKRQYNSLFKHIKTLENCKDIAKTLIDKKSSIPLIPYLDELIDDEDDYVIDRMKQLTLKEKILGVL